ncbi:cytidyltransferase [Methanobrevibacter acididurans]|uniref:cytidyltransferase n=1 Tax=Methanobrevibacter acididurans TaxID=120963 RepID=UPI0038FBF2AD
MIGISADFDPVHLGHEQLIQSGKKIANKTGDKVVVYLNKGYSANHAPFFCNFNARAEMAKACGADVIVPVEGLHHRLTLSYSVPIRASQMIEDGITDYISAAEVSPEKIKKMGDRFVREKNFLGMPREIPNRNVVRWYAVNEFLKTKFEHNMKVHIIPELEKDGKISGRFIRKSIIENDMEITDEVENLLPKSSIKIIKREIDNGTINNQRNYRSITHKMNTYSRGDLTNIAYLNADAVNAIIEARQYQDPESIWAVFRRVGYGPVLTRLATSAIEKEVSKNEVVKLMRTYEAKGVIPPEQIVDKVIQRAFYVASEVENGELTQDANERFRSENIEVNNVPLSFEGGLNITKFETKKLKRGLKEHRIPAKIYVDKDNMLSCEIKEGKFKIKTILKLPALHVTYLRYIIDSQFIPVRGEVVERDRGLRVKIYIHDN